MQKKEEKKEWKPRAQRFSPRSISFLGQKFIRLGLFTPTAPSGSSVFCEHEKSSAPTARQPRSSKWLNAIIRIHTIAMSIGSTQNEIVT
jgi:hypothetical protein